MCDRYIAVRHGFNGYLVDTEGKIVLETISLHHGLFSGLETRAKMKTEEHNRWQIIERELESLKGLPFGEFIDGPEPSGAYTLRLNDNAGVYAMIDWDSEYRVGLYVRDHNEDEGITDLKSFNRIEEVRDYLILLETVFS